MELRARHHDLVPPGALLVLYTIHRLHRWRRPGAASKPMELPDVLPGWRGGRPPGSRAPAGLRPPHVAFRAGRDRVQGALVLEPGRPPPVRADRPRDDDGDAVHGPPG